MVSMYVWKPQENVNQTEEKAEKYEFFFWKYVWWNWIKVKSSIVFQIEFSTVVYTTQTYWYRYRYLVSIPQKIVSIVSVSYRFEKAGIAHPYKLLNKLLLSTNDKLQQTWF